MANTAPLEVRIRLLSGGRMPQRMTEGAAGLDCFAAIETVIRVYPDCRAEVPLGFAVEVPPRWAMHVVPKSGLAFRHAVVEYWGTIDSDYRGGVKALLFNHGDRSFDILPGMAVCQLLFLPVADVTLVEAVELSETARGDKGFGSTTAGDAAFVCDEEWHNLLFTERDQCSHCGQRR